MTTLQQDEANARDDRAARKEQNAKLDVLTNALAALRQEFSVAVTALEEKFSTAVTAVTTEIIKHQQRINQLETEQPKMASTMKDMASTMDILATAALEDKSKFVTKDVMSLIEKQMSEIRLTVTKLEEQQKSQVGGPRVFADIIKEGQNGAPRPQKQFMPRGQAREVDRLLEDDRRLNLIVHRATLSSNTPAAAHDMVDRLAVLAGVRREHITNVTVLGKPDAGGLCTIKCRLVDVETRNHMLKSKVIIKEAFKGMYPEEDYTAEQREMRKAKKPKMIELYGEGKDEGVYVRLRGTDLQYYGVLEEGGKASWYSWTVGAYLSPAYTRKTLKWGAQVS